MVTLLGIYVLFVCLHYAAISLSLVDELYAGKKVGPIVQEIHFWQWDLGISSL